MAYDIQLQKYVFHNSLRNKSYFTQIKPKYFEEPAIALCFNIVVKYFDTYQEFPKQDTIHRIIDSKNLGEKISHKELEALYDIDLNKVDDKWLNRMTESFIRVRTLHTSLLEHVDYIQSVDITEDNVETVVNSALKVYNEKNHINFVTDVGLDFWDVDTHLPDESSRKETTGFQFFDMVSGGGIGVGELWVLMGQSNVGKSIWLTNFAKNFICNGYNTVYISLEMGAKKVNARIGANMFSIPINTYYQDVDSHIVKDRIKKFKKENGIMFETLGRLWVKKFSTSSFSTIDLESFIVNNIEKAMGIKVHMVVLDYLNLMVNWRSPNSDETYGKIKAIAEDLRAVAGANDWSIVTATQITRGATGASDMNSKDVSESMGLINTADLVAGILQTPEMYQEELYDIKLIKNRDGGYLNTRQSFNIKYQYMSISQTSEPYKQGK